jgi:hypothetical protein
MIPFGLPSGEGLFFIKILIMYHYNYLPTSEKYVSLALEYDISIILL